MAGRSKRVSCKVPIPGFVNGHRPDPNVIVEVFWSVRRAVLSRQEDGVLVKVTGAVNAADTDVEIVVR